MNNIQMFLVFLSVRISSILLVQTWYVPDEYWQSLEVAHRMAFGFGHLTWEWKQGIRSYLYPLLIAVLYKILQFLRLDHRISLILAPRLFQALFSAFADYRFYKWTGNRKWAAFNIATSWFWFYTGSRTIINSVETSLTMIGLSLFPWHGEQPGKNTFLWFVGIACVFRPTAAIPWLPICLYHLSTSTEKKRVLLKEYLPIALSMFLICVAVDTFCHGSVVITSWEFLKFNVLQDVGSWYGTQPWYWYLSSGLPAILGIQILPFILGTIKTVRDTRQYPTNLILLSSILFTVFVHSCLSHKEFRFLLPILPMALYISSDLITRWSYKAHVALLWFAAVVILISNLIPACYLSLVHQRGTLDIMQPLSNLEAKNTSVLFLMPCHSTPLYSHIHENITTRFLTCEPNLKNQTNYKDEATNFYENPEAWLYKMYPPNGTLPTHIVTFDSLVPSISSILSRYKPIHRFFHASVPVENRIGNYIIIHERLDK